MIKPLSQLLILIIILLFSSCKVYQLELQHVKVSNGIGNKIEFNQEEVNLNIHRKWYESKSITLLESDTSEVLIKIKNLKKIEVKYKGNFSFTGTLDSTLHGIKVSMPDDKKSVEFTFQGDETNFIIMQGTVNQGWIEFISTGNPKFLTVQKNKN